MLKAQVIGNLGSDPDMRYTASGMAVLSFNIASNSRVKGPGGEWQDSTEWVRCSIFGDRAEKLSPHLARGQRVYVDGKLESRPWADRTNSPRAGLELIVSSIELVSSRERDEDPDQRRRQPVAAGARYQTGADDLDLDEVPF